MRSVSSKYYQAATIGISVLGLLILFVGFQNCAKKPGDTQASSLSSSVVTLTGPLDAYQTLKLLADGSKSIISIRTAAFNGTYPNQNPDYAPSGAEVPAFNSCVVTTDAQGSSLQSKPGKSCPFSLNITTSPLATAFHFAVLDPALYSSFAIISGDCNSQVVQSLISGGKTTVVVNLSCIFSTIAGTLTVTGQMREAWDAHGSGHRLEDSTNLTIGAAHHSYGMLVDTLAVPALPLAFTVDSETAATLPTDSPYPTKSIWPLLSF